VSWCHNAGSSPRVWGIRRLLGCRAWQRRFIPTRVGNTGVSASQFGQNSVHPHACGEYAACQGFHHDPNRFIPTRVGNTGTVTVSGGGGEVHPHACGEYHLAPRNLPPQVGSSPRVWGIRLGKRKQRRTAEVHPHACGEYGRPGADRGAAIGSSPRVWGIHALILGLGV